MLSMHKAAILMAIIEKLNSNKISLRNFIEIKSTGRVLNTLRESVCAHIEY